MRSHHRIALAIACTAFAGAAVAVPTAIAAPTPAAPGTPHGTVTPRPSNPTTPPAQRKLTVTVQAPGSLTAPALLVVSGARPGSQLEAAAGRDDHVQAETIASAYADANGRAVLRLAAPNGRWPANSTYRWGVSGESEADGVRQGTFRTPSTSTKPPATKPPATKPTATKPSTGGLAKTGV